MLTRWGDDGEALLSHLNGKGETKEELDSSIKDLNLGLMLQFHGRTQLDAALGALRRWDARDNHPCGAVLTPPVTLMFGLESNASVAMAKEHVLAELRSWVRCLWTALRCLLLGPSICCNRWAAAGRCLLQFPRLISLDFLLQVISSAPFFTRLHPSLSLPLAINRPSLAMMHFTRIRPHVPALARPSIFCRPTCPPTRTVTLVALRCSSTAYLAR